MKHSLALALILKTASALICENGCVVPATFQTPSCKSCVDSPGKSSGLVSRAIDAWVWLLNGGKDFDGYPVGTQCAGCRGNAAARSICITLKRGMACPQCYQRCENRLAKAKRNKAPARCLCLKPCTRCAREGKNKDCAICYGHGKITKLLPKFGKGARIIFRLRKCQDKKCRENGPCKDREEGQSWWKKGNIEDNSGYMGNSGYDIIATDVGCTDYYATRNVDEEDIESYVSDVVVENLLHPEPAAPAAASPRGVAGGDDCSVLEYEEKREDHEPDTPVPSSPQAPKGFGDLTIPVGNNFPDTGRRRLQHLIKRFQKVSLQCQGNNN